MADKLLIHAIGDAKIVAFQEASVLDRSAAQEIGESLGQLVGDKPCRKIIIDFSQVHLLSSAALGILIDLKKKVDAIKGQLVLCGVGEELMKAWTSTHLHKMFTFCPSSAQALAVLGVSTAG